MRLVKGKGSPDTGACWMSAIHYYTRTDQTWSDHPACVSPVIGMLAMALNDLCEDGERETLIGPHLFAPVGTNTGLADDLIRTKMAADVASEWAKGIVDADACLLAVSRAKAAHDKVTKASTFASAGHIMWAESTAVYAAQWALYTAGSVIPYIGLARCKKELLNLILRCCAVGAKQEVCQRPCTGEAWAPEALPIAEVAR